MTYNGKQSSGAQIGGLKKHLLHVRARAGSAKPEKEYNNPA